MTPLAPATNTFIQASVERQPGRPRYGPAVTRDEWIAAFASEVGSEPPSAEEVEAILALAGVAAHASERTAAPLACWIGAQAGVPAERCLEVAKGIAPAGEAD